MTSIDTHHAAGTSAAPPAVAAWITSADHKQVGRLYVGTGLLGLLGGLVLAVLVGFERIDAEGYQLLDANSATQVLAAARLLLTFGAVAPLLIGLAVAVVPLQLGARALALPRLAAGGFWMWLTGLGLAVASIIANGGPGGGSSDMVDLYVLGSIVMAAGLMMTAISVATSVLTTRAPGMGILRAPMFSWSALVGSVTLVLALPVFIGTSIYLFVDHKYARAAFGGNIGVSQWAGWALSQPFTYLLAIPALGMVLDIVPVMARASLAQRAAANVAIGIVSLSVLATVTQSSVTLPWSGEKFLDNLGDKIADLLPWGLLTVLPLLGVLGVLGSTALTLKNGKPRVAAPLVFAMHGLLTILLGVAAHVLSSIDDAGLRGSIFEAGTYVAITFGTVTIAFGAVCYWGPKLWGRRISDKAALPLGLFALLGTVLVAVAYMIAGFADQPSGALDGFSYSGPQELWNTMATAGFAVMLLTSLAFVALALKSFTSGEAAGDDPWDGQTLEWATSSPPPIDNFSDLVVVGSATPLADLKSNSNGKDA